MTLYICKKASSDMVISGDATFILSRGTDATDSIGVTVASGGDTNIHFITDQGTPNSDSWESGGTATIEVNITAFTGTLRLRCRVRRFSATGAVLQNGVFPAFQNITGTGVLTFNMTVPTWTTAEEACGNRFVVTLNFNNTAGGGGTATIETGTANTECESTISENTGNCRRIFIS